MNHLYLNSLTRVIQFFPVVFFLLSQLLSIDVNAHILLYHPDSIHKNQYQYQVTPKRQLIPPHNNCLRFDERDTKEWNFANHSENYWHVTFGVFIPLIVGVAENNDVIIGKNNLRTQFMFEVKNIDQSKKFGTILHSCMTVVGNTQNENSVHLNFVSELDPTYCPYYSTIKRCDIPGPQQGSWVPVPRTVGQEELNKAVSYFDTCKKENTFIKFRKYLAELTPQSWGLKAGLPHYPSSSSSRHVLIVLRKCRRKHDLHTHHHICFEDNMKLQMIVKEFESLGFSSHVAEFSHLTVAEQAELFSNASIVILPHGAEIANGIYARSGTLFVEITPYFMGIFSLSIQELLMKQTLEVKRDMLQSLAQNLWSNDIFVSHIAIPATPTYARKFSENGGVTGTSCGVWSCLEPKEFVDLVVKEQKQLFDKSKLSL